MTVMSETGFERERGEVVFAGRQPVQRLGKSKPANVSTDRLARRRPKFADQVKRRAPDAARECRQTPLNCRRAGNQGPRPFDSGSSPR